MTDFSISFRNDIVTDFYLSCMICLLVVTVQCAIKLQVPLHLVNKIKTQRSMPSCLLHKLNPVLIIHKYLISTTANERYWYTA